MLPMFFSTDFRSGSEAIFLCLLAIYQFQAARFGPVVAGSARTALRMQGRGYKLCFNSVLISCGCRVEAINCVSTLF